MATRNLKRVLRKTKDFGSIATKVAMIKSTEKSYYVGNMNSVKRRNLLDVRSYSSYGLSSAGVKLGFPAQFVERYGTIHPEGAKKILTDLYSDATAKMMAEDNKRGTKMLFIRDFNGLHSAVLTDKYSVFDDDEVVDILKEIANKKYCISNRIVEVLLDPVYNSRISKEIDLPQNYFIKKKLSDIFFSNLSEKLLFDFSKIYRGNGMTLEERIHHMRELIVTISDELERKNTIMAYAIRGAINDIENNIRDEEKEESSRVAEQAPNLWLLYNLLLLVENQIRKTSYVVDVIYDAQVKYDSHIQNMYEFIKTHEFMNQLYHIGEIIFSDSKSDVGVQAADILAGSVNMILKCKCNNWGDDQSFCDIFNIVWQYILDFDGEECHTAYIENEDHFNEVCKFYE